MKIKFYFLYLTTSILFLFLGFLPVNEMYSVNYYDTYYVISSSDTKYLFAILFGLPFLIYLIFDFLKIQFSKIAMIGYFFLLLIIAISFFYLNILSSEFELKTKVLEDLINPPNFNKYIFFSILLLISLQIFFIFNIFVIITKNLRLSRHLYK